MEEKLPIDQWFTGINSKSHIKKKKKIRGEDIVKLLNN